MFKVFGFVTKKYGGNDKHSPHNLYSNCQLPLFDCRLQIGYRMSIRRNDSDLKYAAPEIASIPDCEFTKLLLKVQVRTVKGQTARRIPNNKSDLPEYSNDHDRHIRAAGNHGEANPIFSIV